jgi:hypothetical protein
MNVAVAKTIHLVQFLILRETTPRDLLDNIVGEAELGRLT